MFELVGPFLGEFVNLNKREKSLIFWQFCKYFFHYIFYVKTRQRLLFLSVLGLFLSSMSLIILQSTLGGLQNKVISRSKYVQGTAVIHLKNKEIKFAEKVLEKIQSFKIDAYLEYEIELLLKNYNYISPVVVHAFDFTRGIPPFLRGSVDIDGNIGKGLIVPTDLASRLKISFGDEVQFISPSHVDSFLGDIPRVATVTVVEITSTNVPEIDKLHVWSRLSLIQNLIRKRHINTIRVYSPFNFRFLNEVLNKEFGEEVKVLTWEEQNSTLVGALMLESTVLTFLFIAMTMLVSLTITSGLMIFFDKIKLDLASFWILGASKKKLETAAIIFLNLMSGFSIVGGLIFGLIFLWFLDYYAIELMPSIFIDRKIPVLITFKRIVVSLLVPYCISIVFSTLSLNQFKKEKSFLKSIREY